jgi:hypothetical protein
MPQAQQNNLIWTADAMFDVDPVFMQNEGYARGCHGLVYHALRSASGEDAQAHRHRGRPRPSVWR